MARRAAFAERARKRIAREQRFALADPAHIAKIESLRAQGYLVIDAPGALVAMRWLVPASETV